MLCLYSIICVLQAFSTAGKHRTVPFTFWRLNIPKLMDRLIEVKSHTSDANKI